MQIFVRYIDNKLYLLFVEKTDTFNDIISLLREKSKIKYEKINFYKNTKLIKNYSKTLEELNIKDDDEISTKIIVSSYGFIYLINNDTNNLIDIDENINNILKSYVRVNKANKIITTIFECINHIFINKKFRLHMYNKKYYYKNELIDIHTPLYKYDYVSTSTPLNISLIKFY